MQLTKLELKGFKSFADKVVINFDKGVTGIVGPNGCGKSNVVDSIRWVLGEQKIKNLRSDKMENVIFNGTKARKATQLAEVSLSFDNTRNVLPTEYSQVTITRRYYRTGDSEYLLNGITCRLKDIQNLFMDTGIASNSYAIIELGMVDDLLNDKDNSRRQLFEEAAGISKFRKRRKETMRKLESTDDDLERVEDLLFEIEKNLKSLEKQAKQAQKYYAAKEEYKEGSVALAVNTVHAQREAFEKINKQLAEENDKKVQLSRQLNEQEAKVEALKADMMEREKLLASRQKSLNAFVEKIREQENQQQINSERLNFMKNRSEQLKVQLQQDQESVGQMAESLENLNKEKDKLEETLGTASEKVGRLKEEYEAHKAKTTYLKEEAAHAETTLKEKREYVYQLKKSLEIKQVQINNTKQELEQTTADASEHHSNLTDFDLRSGELSSQLSALKQQYEDVVAEEQALISQIEEQAEEIEALKENLVQTNRKQDALQNEYNLTKSLVDNLEGFPEAIRFLKRNTDWGENVPLLSDIFGCSEQHKVAIEHYLGTFMNYYVVESRDKALEGVNLLSDATKGKANFFVLEKLESFTPKAPKPLEGATPAIDIVDYEPEYEKLMHYILDGVYILHNGTLKKIPEENEVTLITQDGRVLQRPCSISGGSVGLFEGKRVGRVKNMEKIAEDLEQLQASVTHLEETIAEKQRQLVAMKEKSQKNLIKDLEEEMNVLKQERISVTTKHEQLASMAKNNAQKKENAEAQISQLTEEFDDIMPKLDQAEAELLKYEDNLRQLSERLSEENEELSEKSTTYNEENIAFFQQESRLKSITQEIEYKEDAYHTKQQAIEKNEQELDENASALEQLVESKDFNEESLLDMYAEKEQIEAGVNEAEKAYYAIRGDIDKTEKQGREFQQQRSNCDALIMEAQNKLNETKLSLNSVKERLQVEFEVDLDAILKEETYEEVEDIGALREKVNKLKDRLQRMGPINPMAMEAFEEIKERHDFIIKEREDLFEAKASLIETIDELDTVARETFMDAFYKIKENFMLVFRSLFNEEDDCDLTLTNPDDPLSSSIEIIARPKGKKPLTINQLSGGEKTLTATSLLFSIYLLKPAPFCIFDEVDAPLDDANIDKFNTIIKKFSKESQFIIVTHNKRTMASTDIMYGITMAEQGVSKVVPVDLRELVDD